MAEGKLVFLHLADGSARLVFGDAADTVAPETSISVDGTFPSDSDCSVQLLWDANVSRGEAIELRSAWQQGDPLSNRSATRWQPAQPITARTGTAWQDGAGVAGGTRSDWQESQRHSGRAGQRWQDGDPQRHAARSDWQEGVRLRSGTGQRWQDGDPQRLALLARYQEAVRLRHDAGTRWQDAVANGARTEDRAGYGLPVRIGLGYRWQDAMRPPVGVSLVVPVEPPAEELCYDPDTLGRLEFVEPWSNSGRLVFVCIRGSDGGGGVNPPVGVAPLAILPARFYMIVHSLIAHRLPDLSEVPIFDVQMASDVGSYAWTFSASAPVSVFDQLAQASGVPQQIRITLDGIPFAFVVDSLAREEKFGRRSVRIAGRSLTAALARPYARETQRLSTAQMTAQQLALQALDLSGFGLDWGLTDWLVPAGAWSHTGTPLAAVQRIVEAAGGYVQSARNAATLLARHPYPTLPGGMLGGPWNWYAGTVIPDVELAPDALVTTSIERVDGVDANAIYVAGVTQGVQRLVRRTGTAGDKLAGPMVTDDLMTAQEVALQRGTAILGACGPKHLVRVDLPLLTGASQPGVLDVGQLVQVNESTPWRGRVRSVSVSAAMGREVRQNVQIERHLEVAT